MGKFEKDRKERQERRAASGGGGLYFRVGEDEEEQFRILDDYEQIEKNAAYFHEMPPSPGRKYGWNEICLDQDEEGNRIGAECPGCEENEQDWESCKRKMIAYANVIWRDAPVRKKNEKNKWVDTDESEDQLAVWEIKQAQILDMLPQKHITYKDLTSRDFVMRRRGTGFDTTYSIEPAVDEEGESRKTPMSKEDKELAEKAPDLSVRIAHKELEDWGKPPKKKKDDEDEEGSKGSSRSKSRDRKLPKESPFSKKNRKKSEDDE